MSGAANGLPRIVRAASPAGQRLLARLARRGRGVLDPKLVGAARRIVGRVRRQGDEALLAYAQELDGSEAASAAELLLGPPRLDEEEGRVDEPIRAALEVAIARVERFHRPQRGRSYSLAEDGAELAEIVRPLARVGVYVPGGLAVYPSTVVMTVVPARLAGVPEIVVVTPPKAYRGHSALRWVLARLGVTEVWGLGGAQAVAALAYGTETLARVDKIVGPGNAWVTAAKREVIGDVAIDGLAGPSEVVILADGSADPALVAADLLAQAEHDPRAAAVLVTRSRSLIAEVSRELEAQLADLPTAETAREALAAYGACFLVASAEEALAVAERLAPEHLQLLGPEAEALAERVRNAGAVFVGAASGEVLGDYLVGPSHVLPTCGSARFASGLGVADFERRFHRVRLTGELAGRLAPHAEALAEAEGLPAHARAARQRRAP